MHVCIDAEGGEDTAGGGRVSGARIGTQKRSEFSSQDPFFTDESQLIVAHPILRMTYAIDELDTNLSQFSRRADEGRASPQIVIDQTKNRRRSNIAHCVGTDPPGDLVWVDISQKTLSLSAGTLVATQEQNSSNPMNVHQINSSILWPQMEQQTMFFQVFLKFNNTNS